VPIIVAIVIATLPTGIIGLVLKKSFERMLSSPGAVGIALAVTGVVLWATRWFDRSRRGANPEAGCHPLTMFRAFIMGIAQGIAVTPGISRSGATISTGLFLGLDRETAGKFSFLLSVPAVLAANLLELKDVTTLGAVQIHNIIGATIAAAAVGYICLRLVMPIIKRGRFYFFAYYCWFAAIVALILSCL
jgi:undecaprenyl-diphosphatase